MPQNSRLWILASELLIFLMLMCPSALVQANATLNDFANLRKHSEDWIESSNYIINSAQILSQTLPMLQVRKCLRSFLSPPDYSG